MKNRLAIIAASAALVLTVAGLLGTIAFFVAGDGADAEPVEPNDFTVAQLDVEPDEETDQPPGQAKSKKAEPDAEEMALADDEIADEEADDEEAEMDATEDPTTLAKAEPKAKPRRPINTRRAPTKRVDYKPAVLQVVTNFAQADVTVNGLPYPEYFEPGEPEGMVLPAGGPYDIQVKFGENTKVYQLHLRPHETRLLMVELSGYKSGPPPPPKKVAKKEPKKKEEKKSDNNDQDKPGKITVYSKPAGVVVVDGKNTGEKTPGSVELENGRHEVQVEYETGSVSEKKIVRVRTGSRIKLFFRERK